MPLMSQLELKWTATMKQLMDLANRDPVAQRWAKNCTFDLMLGIEPEHCLIEVRGGRVAAVKDLSAKLVSWDFAISGPRASWQAHWAPIPAPTFHDIIAMRTAGHISIEGELTGFFANILYVKRLLELPRAEGWLQ